MPFEYDKNKSRENLDKHGIDFEQAQELWLDENAFEAKTPYTREERFTRTGRTGSKIWTAVFAPRGENIRIISVRRAHAKEERQYKSLE